MLDTTPTSVDCGFKLKVTQANAFQTLTLTPPPGDAQHPVDPIFTHDCDKDGIQITNPSGALAGLGFTLDCGTNQFRPIRGTAEGKGITLKGFGLAVFNCYIDNFSKGIFVSGDAADVEDNRVTKSTGDGFTIRAAVPLSSINLNGITMSGNRAINNRGWGFNMVANAVDASPGSFFNNVANHNGKGGFLIKGNGNALSGANASSNGILSDNTFVGPAPGIFVLSTSCCSNVTGFQDLDTAQVDSNTGPGIVYATRNDLSNCDAGNVNCLPAGFDRTPGGIDAIDNGSAQGCPTGSIDPTGTNRDICLRIVGGACKQAALDKCP
jgi:hypothetical protein